MERAFRAFNTDLDIRPIRHRTETRVRAHVFLRMLSYYISWHMQARLAPVLFADDDKPAAQAARPSPAAPATRSPRALAKAATKRTPAGLPVHSFASLLADLATICLNTIQPADPAQPGFRLVTTPMEHPGFGGDSILPRCSGLGGRCLPRYRRLAEPRSDHFLSFALWGNVRSMRCAGWIAAGM